MFKFSHLSHASFSRLHSTSPCAGLASSSNQFTCTSHRTKQDTDGSGHRDAGALLWLDRHQIDCGNAGVLRQYQLVWSKDVKQIHYNFLCCTGEWLLKAREERHTEFKEDAFKLITIDRLKPDCQQLMDQVQRGKNWALQGFAIQRASNDAYEKKWRYMVKCAEIDIQSTPSRSCERKRVGTTGGFYEFWENAVGFLDALNFQCEGASVLQSTDITSVRSGTSNYWKLIGHATCCDVETGIVPISEKYQDTFIQIKYNKQDKCLIYNDKSRGAEVGSCDNSDKVYNTFYVEPANVGKEDIVMLRPYRKGESDALEYYLRVNEQGLVFFYVPVGNKDPKWKEYGVQLLDTQLYAPKTGMYVMVSQPDGRLVGKQAGEKGYETQWEYEQRTPPTKHANLGKVCSPENLRASKWNQVGCPYLPVIGMGGSTAAGNSTLTVPNDASKMMFVKSARFFIRNKDTPNALIAGIKLNYSPDPADPKKEPFELTVHAPDAVNLPYIDCELPPNEYITQLRIIPQKKGVLATRAISGVWWKTSAGKTCMVWHWHGV